MKITTKNIGRIRKILILPFKCKWNAWVRDVTAKFEIINLTLPQQLAKYLEPMAKIVYNGRVIVDKSLINNNGDIGFNVHFVGNKSKELAYYFVSLDAILEYEDKEKR